MASRHARAVADVSLITLAVTTLVLTCWTWWGDPSFGVDFKTVSPEIRDLVRGTSPYVIEGMQQGGHFLWSVLAGWLLMPFAWLDWGWIVVSTACLLFIPLSLRLLDATDWRPAAAVIAWPSTVNGLQTANITMIVTLLVALAWRHRDRPSGGVAGGLAVAVKFFAWPVLVWMLATRRLRPLVAAVAVIVASVLLMLPYVSIPEFVDYERIVNRVFADEAITLGAILGEWDVPGAQAIGIAVGLGVLAYRPRDLGWCMVAAVLLSPVVWLHYLGVLLVPLALWRPPLWVWLLPLGFWVVPGQGNGSQWQTCLALGTLGLTASTGWRLRERATLADCPKG